MTAPSRICSSHRNAIFYLAAAARLIQRDFDRRSRSFGFNRAQWQVLATLMRSEGEKQVVLAERLDIAPIVLARIIDRLEESGYVERRSDPEDRRAYRLFLTDEAQPLIDQMFELSEQTGARAFQGFYEDDVAGLVSSLGRLCGNLSDTFETEDPSETDSSKEDEQ